MTPFQVLALRPLSLRPPTSVTWHAASPAPDPELGTALVASAVGSGEGSAEANEAGAVGNAGWVESVLEASELHADKVSPDANDTATTADRARASLDLDLGVSMAAG
jgi:hypothetical protein